MKKRNREKMMFVFRILAVLLALSIVFGIISMAFDII
jgi:predicted nucleic acid-binding Zn ribbon protein